VKLIRLLPAVLVFSLMGIGSQVFAQGNFPISPIRIVVAFPPGGSTDVFARLLAQKLSSQMGVSVLVENKPGANGNIGNELVSRSAPDGHTLLFNTSAVVLAPALGEKLSYNVFTDLAPVARFSTVPLVLTVHPSLAANNVKEFIAYLRANPGKLAYGSAGTGNITHLGNLMFLEANGLSALHVPYKGSSPALLDVVGGRLQFSTPTIVSAAPLVKSKRLRGVAVTSLNRAQLLPDIPSLNESAMPGFEVGAWYGVMAPAKTPAAILRKLNHEVLRVLQDPEAKSRLADNGAELFGSAPEEYGAYMNSELERWTKLIKSSGIKVD